MEYCKGEFLMVNRTIPFARNLKVSMSDAELEHLVERCFDEFFKRKIELLQTFDFIESLRNLNIYLLKKTTSGLPSEIVRGLLKTHTNARDEIIFQQVFSELIDHVKSSGETSLDKLLKAVKRDLTKYEEKFEVAWDHAVNQFTGQFLKDFCLPDGDIDWEKLAKL